MTPKTLKELTARVGDYRIQGGITKLLVCFISYNKIDFKDWGFLLQHENIYPIYSCRVFTNSLLDVTQESQQI